jgi:hypothetical protein
VTVRELDITPPWEWPADARDVIKQTLENKSSADRILA